MPPEDTLELVSPGNVSVTSSPIPLTPSTFARRGLKKWKHVLRRKSTAARWLIDSGKITNIEGRSLFVFNNTNSFRKLVIRFVSSRQFDFFIVFVIIINSVIMALENPSRKSSSASWNYVFQLSEIISTAIFFAEMLLKAIAYGLFMGPNTYLHNPWNILDFCIVLVSGISVIFSDVLPNVSVFRVLRPLRMMVAVRGMRHLLQSFLNALPLLLNALVLVFFLFLLWGLVALQVFRGRMSSKCWNLETQLFDEVTIPTGRICGYGRSCPVGYECRESGSNPNWDITSFDDLPICILTIFQVITME
eukprot:980673_1